MTGIGSTFTSSFCAQKQWLYCLSLVLDLTYQWQTGTPSFKPQSLTLAREVHANYIVSDMVNIHNSSKMHGQLQE